MSDCVFCKIVLGEIFSFKVFESENAFAFLDINPASKGHSLVVPKKHFENFEDVSEQVLKELILSVQRTAKAVKKAVGCSGFNIFVSNGKSAGQVIFHLHFHIVPRFENDSVGLNWNTVSFAEKELEQLALKIKNQF